MTALFQLLVQVFIPIFVTILIGILVLYKINKGNKDKQTLSTLNAELGLWGLPLFWMAISLPITLFISFGAPIWITRNLDISFTGYEEFMAISTLPAILLATIIPLTAAISRTYSTHQTANQIGEMLKNKKRDISFKYKSEVTDQINKINNQFENESLVYKTANEYLENSVNEKPKSEKLEHSIDKLTTAISTSSHTKDANKFKIINIFPLFHIMDHEHENNKLNTHNLELITNQLLELNSDIIKYKATHKNNNIINTFSILESLTSTTTNIISDMYHSRINTFEIKNRNNENEIIFTIFGLDIYDYSTLLSITSKIIIEIIQLNYEYYKIDDEIIGELYDKLTNIKPQSLQTGMKNINQLLNDYKNSQH